MYPCSRRRFLAHSATTAGLFTLGADRLLAAPLAADQQADMTIAKWAGAADPDAKAIRDIAVKLTEQAFAVSVASAAL